MKGHNKMDAAITFVLTSEDKARIKTLAKQETRTVSNWVRAVIEAELNRRQAAQTGREVVKN